MIDFNRKAIVGMTVFTTILGLSGCGKGGGEQAGAQNVPTVVVAEVVMRDIHDSARYIGRVEAIDTVDLKARVEGYLDQIAVRHGQSVEQGQALFTIESAPYEAELESARAAALEAKAAADLAEIELERRAKLVASKSISQSDYDTAVANHAAAVARHQAALAQVDLAGIQLGYTEITSPFDGRLGRIARSEGDVVGPGSGSLVNLTRISPIYVVFALAERDLVTFMEEISSETADMDDARAATVNVELPNGNKLPEGGRLVFVDNRVDPATGTIGLRAEFENANGILVPGVYVNVDLGDPESESMPMVPQAALQQDQQGKFVLVVDDAGIVEQRYLTLGRASGAEIIVTQGVKAGEKVITEGLQRVRLGEPVKAVPARQALDDMDGDSGGS